MDKGEVGEAKHKTQWGQRERHSINVLLACSAKADREKGHTEKLFSQDRRHHHDWFKKNTEDG